MSFLCSLPLAASLFASCAAPAPFATGYVEGDYTLVAPVQTAQIAAIKVARGDHVAQGAVLVKMEQRDAKIALAQAQANLARAKGELADLLAGKRAQEIDVIVANQAAAKVQAEEAKRQRDRLVELAQRGVVTDAQRDDAVTAFKVAEAKVAQVTAELAVARLPPRPQAVAQSEAAVAAAEAARAQAKWRLDQRVLGAPVAGTIVDIIRREGEIAGPAAPVLSVLGEGAVKLRLYVPEVSVARIKVGDELSVRCDNCAAGLRARISYVADGPEFTPPVIYSLQNRQKLVYLIEARPDGENELKPGQIVDVGLPGAAPEANQ
ncbi:HlyD family secretion protein [Aquicoccus sp. G2-2]|uniref:HlyD family secretion protein n=1 Tax=Aquicoccus sp. G2-2 TaxID=3092120 RepID=UPI002ADF9B08|nr:HlyD family efflux transporter periplasmic adaptor subunit [Aquicoccus sp. G2-2]MEA1112968.1 HlyD family efflux transporter periplasmic adaptor subunit [Aquicoccus sp. G2-2]